MASRREKTVGNDLFGCVLTITLVFICEFNKDFYGVIQHTIMDYDVI